MKRGTYFMRVRTCPSFTDISTFVRDPSGFMSQYRFMPKSAFWYFVKTSDVK